MQRRTRGGWTKGSNDRDLERYLTKYAKVYGGWPIVDVTHAKCRECGGAVFSVILDDDEGCAVRTCTRCATQLAMFDSAMYVAEAEFEDAACPCGNESFFVAGAMAKGSDGEIRWVFVGLRCAVDNILGSYADWKIDSFPTDELRRSA